LAEKRRFSARGRGDVWMIAVLGQAVEPAYLKWFRGFTRPPRVAGEGGADRASAELPLSCDDDDHAPLTN